MGGAGLVRHLWSQEAVEEALGAGVAGAIPELLRLTDLEVRIPKVEVVALERLAAREATTVSAVLAARSALHACRMAVGGSPRLRRGAGVAGCGSGGGKLVDLPVPSWNDVLQLLREIDVLRRAVA